MLCAPPTLARQGKGEAGTESLVALLLALEAQQYVLSPNSNWGHLINEAQAITWRRPHCAGLHSRAPAHSGLGPRGCNEVMWLPGRKRIQNETERLCVEAALKPTEDKIEDILRPSAASVRRGAARSQLDPYSSSASERAWMTGDKAGKICETAVSEDQVNAARHSLGYSVATWMPARHKARQPTEAEWSALSCFRGKRGARYPIEPLSGMARHPFTQLGCPFDGSVAMASPTNHIPSPCQPVRGATFTNGQCCCWCA